MTGVRTLAGCRSDPADLHVWSLPLRHALPRADRPRRGPAAGRGRLGRVQPVLGLRRRRVRRLVARRPGGRRRRLAGAGARRRPGQRDRPRRRRRRRAHRIVRGLGRLPHREGQGRRAGPVARRRGSRGSRPSATRSGPAARIRVDANAAWDVDDGGRPAASRSTGPRAASSTSSSRAARVDDLAALRRRTHVPIAADESIRRAADPIAVARAQAADVVVLKVAAARRGARVPGAGRAGRAAGRRLVGARDVGRARRRPGARRRAPGAAVRVRSGHRAAARGRRGRPTRSCRSTAMLDGPPARAGPGAARPPRRGRRARSTGRRRRRGRRARGMMAEVTPTNPSIPTRRRRRPACSCRRSPPSVSGRRARPRLAQRTARVRGRRGRAARTASARPEPRRCACTCGSTSGRPRSSPSGWRGSAHGAGDRRSAAPVAVVTTSGTAVANLHPAVLEAHHAGLPLLLLTADRPHELRGTGANQTTDQVGLFAGAVRLDARRPRPGRAARRGRRTCAGRSPRAVAAADGCAHRRPGPGAPRTSRSASRCVPGDAAVARAVRRRPDGARRRRHVAAGGRRAAPVPAVADHGTRRAAGGRGEPTVVVAGDGAGPVARQLAEANGWPLLAEPSSGARGGPHAIAGLPAAARRPRSAEQVRRVVVLGRPTLSPAGAAAAGPARTSQVVVVAPRGRRLARRRPRARPTSCPRSRRWLRRRRMPRTGRRGSTRWRAADAAAAPRSTRCSTGPDAGRRRAAGPGVTGPALARGGRAVARRRTTCSWSGRATRSATSTSSRDWDDAAAGARQPRARRASTARSRPRSGVALGLPAVRSRAYVGDLTFLHDVGGLLRGPARAPAATSRSWSPTTTAARSSRRSSTGEPGARRACSSGCSARRTAPTSRRCAPGTASGTRASTRRRRTCGRRSPRRCAGLSVVEVRGRPGRPPRAAASGSSAEVAQAVDAVPRG